MKRKKHNKEIVVIATLYIASVLTFAAGSLGTYAWYSYNARASAMYGGAAIGDGGSLQVGIFSNVEIPKLEAYSTIKKDNSGLIANYVYWSSGGFSEAQIEAYAETFEYGNGIVAPVTSGPFTNGVNRDISLITSPVYKETRTSIPASKERYLYLPLVFKYGSFFDFDIQLSGLKFKAEDDIAQSVRIGFVDEYYGNAFILNPTAELDGKTKVCGNLDLNGDRYYDTEYREQHYNFLFIHSVLHYHYGVVFYLE